MEHEAQDTKPFFPSETSLVAQMRNSQGIVSEMLALPGRFKSPLSLISKLRLKLFQSITTLKFPGNPSETLIVQQNSYPPLNWQVLFRYLFREKVLSAPGVSTKPVAHDRPKTVMSVLSPFSPTQKGFGGYSSALDVETSLSKATGELLERFFLTSPDSVKMVQASVNHLQKQNTSFIALESLGRYLPFQREHAPFINFDHAYKYYWVSVKDLITHKPLLAPAHCIFLQQTRHQSCWLYGVRESNTNGAAGNFTREEALLSAIYEAVERDGFLIFWLNKIAPPVLDVSQSKDQKLTELLSRVKRYQFEVVFLNITTDIAIPTVLCVLIDRSRFGPKVTVAASCGWDIEKVLLSALCEAIAVENWNSSKQKVFSLPPDYQPFCDPSIGRTERLSLWQNPDMFSRIEPMLCGQSQLLIDVQKKLPSFTNKQQELNYVQKILSRLGYDIYYYEVQSIVLEKVGYHVVKVLIPGLVNLYLRETLAPLDTPRLKTVPNKLGYVAAPEWNPWPHPFP